MKFRQLAYKSIFWRGWLYLAQLLLNLLIARYFEPSGSGKMFYIINNYAFLILLLSLSIDSAIGFYYASNKINAKQLFSLSLLWVALSIIPSYFLLSYFSGIENPDNEFYLSSLAFIAGSLLISLFSALFFAKKDFFSPCIIQLFITVLLVALLLINDATIKQYFFLLFISSFFLQGILLALVFMAKHCRPGFVFQLPNSKEFRWLLRYSLLALLGNVLTFLVFRCDYWFIDYYKKSGDELGNYIQVSKLAQLFFAVPSFLASAVFPLTAGGSKIEEQLKTLVRIIASLVTLIVFLLAVCGYWLFPWLFGEKFNQMSVPFLLLTPGIVAICMAYPISGYFSGKAMIRTNIIASLLALVIIVLGNIIFIPHYGIVGAAAVSSVGYVVLFLYLFYCFIKRNQLSAIDFFVIKRSDLKRFKSF